MFKSKWLNRTIVILLLLTVFIISGYFYLQYRAHNKTSEQPSIDEIVDKQLVKMDEMTTNLKNDQYIKIALSIQVTSEDAKNELKKMQFRVKNTIITLLADMEAKHIQGKKGINAFEGDVKQAINEYLNQGKVDHVFITKKLVQ